MNWHPYANRYKLIEGDDYEAFKADIQANGLTDPIKVRMVDGAEQGLDGRNRERACKDLGITCKKKIVDVPDSKVKEYIDSLNTWRRHLTKAERDKLAGKRRKRVARKKKAGKSLRTIAAEENVSVAQVQRDLEEEAPRAPGGARSPEPAATPPAQPESRLILELQHRDFSPRIMPQIESLDEAQQYAFLARLAEGVYPQTALLEVMDQVKKPPQDNAPKAAAPAPAACQHCPCYFTLKEENDRLRKTQKPPAKPKASANGSHVRCPVFDAIAKVTASDPKVSGSHIAKVRNKLLQGEPPYTAEEVYRWGELVDVWLKGSPPSLGLLEKSIGQVRATPKKGERLFAGFQAFLDKENK